MRQDMTVLTSSNTQEWYTPKVCTDAARLVMGSIDLDPASHEIPQTWIDAAEFYTKEDDALSRPWGERYAPVRVFLNPPYGKTGNKSNQQIWSDYLIQQYTCGNVGQAILLTKTVPGYKWWDDLFNDSCYDRMCITRGRISFVNSDGVTAGMSKSASSFWYFGDRGNVFAKIFSRFGRILL